MAIRSNSSSGNTDGKNTGAGRTVCCMDCIHSKLMQYGCNPIIADCYMQPQPGNERFPYQREVARAMRICRMHAHTDEVKEIEKRAVA